MYIVAGSNARYFCIKRKTCNYKLRRSQTKLYNAFYMKQFIDDCYLTPEITVIQMEVEGVLAASNMESVIEKEEQDW